MITVQNRPFSTDVITGLMLPDGIFDATLGQQRINAHFTNQGAAAAPNTTIYIESVSHPGIVVSPTTHAVSPLAGSASRVLSWLADFSGAPEGIHYVSFIAESGPDRTRSIKKIFVTRVKFDPATTTFSVTTPEGVLSVRFRDLVVPNDLMCCGRKRRRGHPEEEDKNLTNLMNYVGKLFTGHKPDFIFCPPGYLPLEIDVTVVPTPPYGGQYGDLPFEDPWWKILLCIIAVILLIAASVVASETDSGEIIVTTNDGTGPPEDCCGVDAEGGSDSYVVAGLVAAAAAATAAAASDVRDPFRRGQDNTAPNAGEVTVAETLWARFAYPEPIVLGKPFSVGLKWRYTRTTNANTYSFDASDLGQNIHVLSKYVITAPEVVYRHEPFVVKAEFSDRNEKKLAGDQLLVQCFLIGPKGQYRSFTLQDDGIYPDDGASDGVYTGLYHFRIEKEGRGLWRYFVIAQDINNAQPDMSPEEAAKIIGGMVLTSQLVITFDEDECPFVPDGFVNVI